MSDCMVEFFNLHCLEQLLISCHILHKYIFSINSNWLTLSFLANKFELFFVIVSAVSGKTKWLLFAI